MEPFGNFGAQFLGLIKRFLRIILYNISVFHKDDDID